MTKALLTNINSVWGVITNPQSSNTYRHILSFENETQKKQFVSKELLNGADFDTTINAQPNIALSQITASISEFRVKPENYPNETINSLLNKDFAIIKEELFPGKTEYRYYTLTSKRIGNVIEYTAELDIFFTHDIKDMFNDKPARVKQAMLDRYHKIGSEIRPVTYGDNVDYSNPIFNHEDFAGNIDDVLIANEQPKPLKYDFSHILVDDKGNKITDPAIIDEMNRRLALLRFEIIAQQDDFGTGFDGLLLPYKFHVAPILDLLSADGVRVLVDHPTLSELFTEVTMNNSLKSDPKTIKNSSTIIHSFWLLDYLADNNNLEYKKIEYHSNTHMYFIRLKGTPEANGHVSLTGTLFGFDVHKQTFELNNIYKLRPEPYKEEMKWGIDYKFNKPVTLSKDNKHNNFDNEIKSNFSPFSSIRLKTSGSYHLDIQKEYANKENIFIRKRYSYQLEANNHVAILEDYYNINTKNNAVNDIYYNETVNYSLPTSVVAWEEFLIRNKSQQNAGWLNKGLTAGVGLLGVLASPFTAGTSLGVTALAGASLAAHSASGIVQQLAQRQDIKNTPNKTISTGSSLISDATTKGFYLKTIDMVLPPNLKNKINQHFYKYGYNIDNKLYNINDLIKNRYYFNYIEASETFENIKLQASAEIKQIINDTLANGVTIWNVRDLTDFKGIKNYDYENVEISLLTTK